MLVFVLLLSLAIAVNSDSLNLKPQISPNESTHSTTSLPSNYTLQTSYSTSYQPSYITYSPDQNWLIYNTFITNLTNILFIRHKNNLTPEYQVKLGNSSIPMQRISSFAFSASGDLLFIGTWSNYLFVCNFTVTSGHIMKDEDCLKSYFLGNYNVVYTVMANSLNKLVAGGDDNLWVFNFTSNGDLELQSYMKLAEVSFITAIWHPKAEQDTLIIYGKNFTYPLGFMSVYNISSKATFTLNTSAVFQINILNDGHTLLATQYYRSYSSRLNQYNLSLTSVTEVGTVLQEQLLYIYKVSLVADLVLGWTLKRSQPVVYQVVNQSGLLHSAQSYKSTTNATIALKEIFHVEGSFQMYCYDFSTDLNQMLLPVKNSSLILRYSLFLGNTYLTNFSCLNCSIQCKSCHLSPDLCYECTNNTYFIKNSSCLKCNTVMIGCSSCGNQSFCLLCDKLGGFIQKPLNNTCTCLNSYTLFSGKCFACFVQGCATCNQDNICYECGSGFNVSGKCIKTAIIGIIVLACALLVIAVGVFIYRKCKTSKKRNQRESLLIKV